MEYLFASEFFLFADINECDLKPCQNGGHCYENANGPGYYCICPKGFNGINCEISMYFS